MHGDIRRQCLEFMRKVRWTIGASALGDLVGASAARRARCDSLGGEFRLSAFAVVVVGIGLPRFTALVKACLVQSNLINKQGWEKVNRVQVGCLGYP